MAKPNRINWRNVLTVVSIMILIGTEVFAVALSGGWALAGLFDLGATFGYILMGLFSLIAAYALVVLWRHCVKIEPLTKHA